MAYAIPKDAQCTEAGCTRRADYIVKNNRNEIVRECCRLAGLRRSVDLSAEEEARARG